MASLAVSKTAHGGSSPSSPVKKPLKPGLFLFENYVDRKNVFGYHDFSALTRSSEIRQACAGRSARKELTGRKQEENTGDKYRGGKTENADYGIVGKKQ